MRGNTTTNSYKGFETWWNGLRMSAKMYIYVFVIFLVFQIIITIGVSYLLHGHRYSLFFGYLMDVFKSHSSPDMSIVSEYVRYFFWQTISIFVASAVIYFAFPFAIGIFKGRARKLSATTHLDGAGFMSAEEFSQNNGEVDLPFGSFRLPVQEEIKHCLAIGKHGTGKTVFLSGIVERLNERNEKGIIYDFKGDYTSRFYNPERDILFNPLDKRCKGWNLFNDIKTKLDINMISSSLIPPTYTGDAFWHDAARGVFSGIIHHLWRDNKKTNEELWKGVTAPGQVIHDWLQGIPEGQTGFRYIEDASGKQALSVFATMMQYTSAFEYMASLEQNDFSLTEWLTNKKPGFIFVTNQADVKDTLKPILSLFIDFVGKKLISLPDDLQRRVFFLLDEFGTLQMLSSIKELLITSRSKGGSCWLGIQDIGQLNKLYTKDTANTIINACGSSLMFGIGDPDTAQYLVRKVGDTEILETEETVSMGVSNYRDGVSMTKRRKRQRLLMDSHFLDLPDLQAYAKVPNKRFITLTKFNYKKYPEKIIPFIIRDNLRMDTVDLGQNIPGNPDINTVQLLR
jgi:type IV secretory pathway TraG/TraD family ATPase VirD4